MSKCAAEPQTCLYISAERSSLSTEMDISVSGSSASVTTAESRDSGCLCGFFYCGQDRDENTDKSKGEQNKSDINLSAGGSVTVVPVPQAIKCREHLWGVRRGRQRSINLFHFREETQILVEEHVCIESNEGTTTWREGLRPFGETVMDSVTHLCSRLQCV